MTGIGAGPEDWVDLDLDLLDRQRRDRVMELLEVHHDRVVDVLGAPFDVVDEADRVLLVVDGRAVASAERTPADRLLVTRLPSDDPAAPL